MTDWPGLFGKGLGLFSIFGIRVVRLQKNPLLRRDFSPALEDVQKKTKNISEHCIICTKSICGQTIWEPMYEAGLGKAEVIM